MQHSRSDLQVHLGFTFCSAFWHDGDADSLSNLFEILEIIGDRVQHSVMTEMQTACFLLIFGFSHGVYEVGDFGFTGEVNDTIRVFSTYYSYMGCAIFGFP